jgi:hypothetical protein
MKNPVPDCVACLILTISERIDLAGSFLSGIIYLISHPKGEKKAQEKAGKKRPREIDPLGNRQNQTRHAIRNRILHHPPSPLSQLAAVVHALHAHEKPVVQVASK